ILKRKPALTPFETAALGSAGDVRAQIAKDAAFVHSFSRSGWTPLHYASFGDNAAAVSALIDAGADVNARAKNHFANTPLQVPMPPHEIGVERARDGQLARMIFCTRTTPAR